MLFNGRLAEDVEAQELIARWVAALRSGSYAQGSGQLRHRNDFCCLGVLCDAVESERWRLASHSEDGYIYLRAEGSDTDGSIGYIDFEGAFRYEGSKETLPRDIRERACLAGANGGFGDGTSLAGLNDAGVPFTDIANLIEAALEEAKSGG
jgi:hypothetical protein